MISLINYVLLGFQLPVDALVRDLSRSYSGGPARLITRSWSIGSETSGCSRRCSRIWFGYRFCSLSLSVSSFLPTFFTASFSAASLSRSRRPSVLVRHHMVRNHQRGRAAQLLQGDHEDRAAVLVPDGFWRPSWVVILPLSYFFLFITSNFCGRTTAACHILYPVRSSVKSGKRDHMF